MNLEEFATSEELRAALRRTQQQLTKANAKVEDLVEATISASRDATLAMGPIKPVPAPRLQTARKQAIGEVALWHMTDWQGSKVTTSYNSEVMVNRVMLYCHKAAHLTDIQRSHHPVDDVTILFGGDMIEGLFNYPTQAFEIDSSIFGQYVKVSRLLVDVVQYALSIYNHVTVVAEWGNHGRIGGKQAGVPRPDNFDRMCYELARQLLANEPRLTWEDCPEDIQYVEIGNYQALLIHGDEVGRNGFASPMTILRHANQWRSGAYPKPFRDVYIGHYHTHNEWAMANGYGAVYQSGSTESDNRYARETMAASAIPTQRLHFIDPEKGRVTAQYKVWLDE